jgi:hypothetical protein
MVAATGCSLAPTTAPGPVGVAEWRGSKPTDDADTRINFDQTNTESRSQVAIGGRFDYSANNEANLKTGALLGSTTTVDQTNTNGLLTARDSQNVQLKQDSNLNVAYGDVLRLLDGYHELHAVLHWDPTTGHFVFIQTNEVGTVDVNNSRNVTFEQVNDLSILLDKRADLTLDTLDIKQLNLGLVFSVDDSSNVTFKQINNVDVIRQSEPHHKGSTVKTLGSPDPSSIQMNIAGAIVINGASNKTFAQLNDRVIFIDRKNRVRLFVRNEHKAPHWRPNDDPAREI